ncbi:hypothetical protein H2248_008747 [Termitomyces sp. 'cryptogamus']|nr:hypothetical protein H2248_008747 [Termitomyces sp. 'cryptogamus']
MTSVAAPKTPESRKARGSSSSGTGRSRVLDVLDTEEPMFLRATLNRILNLPDLAGLSGTGYASKRLRMEDDDDDDGYTRDERKRKKTASPLNDDLQLLHPQPALPSSPVLSPCETGTWLSGNRDRVTTQSTDNINILHTPPEDYELPDHVPVPSISHSNHPGTFNSFVSSLPPSSDQATSSDLTGIVATGAAMNFDHQDWDDSDFDLDFKRHHWTPSPQAEYEQYSTQSLAGVPSQDEDGNEIVAFDESPRRCPRFAENNLYEHQDPWHTIGVILGLSPVRPEDRLLDGAYKEQTFAKNTRYLSENEDQDLDLNEDIPGDVQCWDKSATQLDPPPDEPKDDLDEPIGDAQGSGFTSRQTSPPLLVVQDNPEERTHDTRQTTADIDFDALSHANLSPRSVQVLSSVEEPQSPFRIFLESKRNPASSVHSCNSRSLEVSGSCSRSQSSLVPRTPSPRGTKETQSPFRMLLAARNLDRNQKKFNLNLTDYSFGDSDAVGPLSSPGAVDLSNFTVLKEVDGVFQGPCLFPDDAYDASDED